MGLSAKVDICEADVKGGLAELEPAQLGDDLGQGTH